jgi:hypothetical protein
VSAPVLAGAVSVSPHDREARQCPDTLLKLVRYDASPQAAAAGGIQGALGYRYLTMIVSNPDEIVAALAAADVPVTVPVSEIRPGVRIGMVEDPDDNWVEFVDLA